jgi:hypothetical protein
MFLVAVALLLLSSAASAKPTTQKWTAGWDIFSELLNYTAVGSGTCQPTTRQGVTETIAGVALGVVTTDMNGNGSFTVVVGPIAAGTYVLEFVALNGAGCDLTGGGGTTYDTCAVDFPIARPNIRRYNHDYRPLMP